LLPRLTNEIGGGIRKDVQKIGLYPIPDAAYTLKWDGIKPITLLSATTDDVRIVTGMPSHYVDALIEMATAIGWNEVDDAEAKAKLQEAVLRLEALWKRDSHSIEDTHLMRGFDSDDYHRDPVLPPQYTR
jgi:hypothetical protein